MSETMMLSPRLNDELVLVGLDPEKILHLVREAIAEDLAGGVDVTSTATISPDQISTGDFRARKSGILAGSLIAAAVLEYCGITDYSIHLKDGELLSSGTIIITARGKTRQLLLAERTALNFLGRLSGIATLTRRWVDEVKGTHTIIRDTRKTTPLLREVEKYAVRCGGGENHRMSLSDAALIKDNHVAAAGGVLPAFSAVREKFPDIPIEVEVDSLDQLKEMIAAKADLVLLDNMSVGECRAAVALAKGTIKLEASGGITLENAKAYADTGVDYLAVGALTHSASVLDIGLDFKGDS